MREKCDCKCKCFTKHKWKLQARYQMVDYWADSNREVRVYLCTRCLETKEVKI